MKTNNFVFFSALGAIATLGTFASFNVLAEGEGKTQKVIRHTIKEGDTLEQLSRRYLGEAQAWPSVQARNGGIHPLRLPPGQTLEIPMDLLRKASANVQYVHGSASAGQAGGELAPVEAGQPLREGDKIALGPDAYVTVRLADGTSVRIQTEAQVQVQQLRRRGRSGSLQTVLNLEQGGMEIEVPGGAQNRRSLEVVTPVAMTSVRGTHFDVRVTPNSTSAAVQQGVVAMSSSAQHKNKDKDNKDKDKEAQQNLKANQGWALAQDGTALSAAPTALLAAPELGALPTLFEDAQWLEVALPAQEGAKFYELQLAQDKEATAVVRQASGSDSMLRVAGVDDGQYWLRLRSVDEYGIPGRAAHLPVTVKAHPVAPLVDQPAPGSTAAQGKTTMHCTPVDGASAYVLQVASAQEEKPVLEVIDNANCAFDLSSLPSGEYQWRLASVRWVDGQRDQGPYSAPVGLTLAPAPSDFGAEDIGVESRYGHSQVHWPGAPEQRYRLQAFSTPEAIGTPELDLWLEESKWQVSGLAAGQWHIRIQAQDKRNGLESAFSPMRSVQVLPLVRDGSGTSIQTGAGLGLEH